MMIRCLFSNVLYALRHNAISASLQPFSNENQDLLKLIIECKPQLLSELEKISHRRKSNLSRTLKTLENYGIVSLSKENGRLVPTVEATDFKVEFGLNASANAQHRFDQREKSLKPSSAKLRWISRQ